MSSWYESLRKLQMRFSSLTPSYSINSPCSTIFTYASSSTAWLKFAKACSTPSITTSDSFYAKAKASLRSTGFANSLDLKKPLIMSTVLSMLVLGNIGPLMYSRSCISFLSLAALFPSYFSSSKDSKPAEFSLLNLTSWLKSTMTIVLLRRLIVRRIFSTSSAVSKAIKIKNGQISISSGRSLPEVFGKKVTSRI